MNIFSSTARRKARASLFGPIKRIIPINGIGLIGLIVLLLALAGCAPPAYNAPAATKAAAPTAVPAATLAPAATAVPAATSAPAQAGSTVTEVAMVMVAKNDKLGAILTDDEGKTLYLFTPDSKNTATCYDACAQAWPPLLTAGAPEAGEGADASLLGTTVRTDGTTQVTYNGAPVYHFAKDQKAGDTTGQGVGDIWFVLSAAGVKVTTAQ